MFCKISFNKTDDKPEKALNGEQTADSEPLASEGTTVEEEAVINTYYDKSKSFFDNLSCDDPRLAVLFFFLSQHQVVFVHYLLLGIIQQGQTFALVISQLVYLQMM